MVANDIKGDEPGVTSDIAVAEDVSRLVALDSDESGVDVRRILESLRQDCVVLVRNLSQERADQTMHAVAEGFGLGESLKLHAGFASLYGHRHNINKYFMSVNKREDYQFIPFHSEGNSFSNMQLAAFYCAENTTDGGETILVNVDGSSSLWESMREKTRRGKVGYRPLTPQEMARARAQYRINLPADIVRADDMVLQEGPTEIANLTLVDVLAKPQKSHSRILDRSLYVYWDSIASVDRASMRAYVRLLKQAGLLREPPGGLEVRQMDNAAHRRVWDSKVDHGRLFKCKLTVKLAPGDFVIQNNLTWTHAVSNWSPGSGVRKLAAAFA